MSASALAQGAALLGQGRPAEAQAAFLEALRQQPQAPEPRVGLAQACERLGEPLAASAWLSDACRAAPEQVALWLALARLLSAGQRDAELEPMLRLALALHPAQPALLAMQGELSLRGRQYALALQACERLLARLRPAAARAALPAPGPAPPSRSSWTSCSG